jgi:hypothetical protein
MTFDAIRTGFSNTIILCNGITPETAPPHFTPPDPRDIQTIPSQKFL